MSVADVERLQETSLPNGLTKEEVKRRQEVFGLNEIKQRQPGLFRALLRRVLNTLTILLLLAVLLSLFFREYANALIIFLAVLVDIVFGIIYESYTNYKIYLIKSQVPRITEVIREGKSVVIPVRELVPGDVCILREGERVPADMRLASVRGLRVDESILTGEPGDVEKIAAALKVESSLGDQRNMTFSGTIVTTGSSRGIVVSTGGRSVLGTLAKRVVEAGTQATPLEHRLRMLGGMLGAGLVVTSALIFSAGMLRGVSAEEMFHQALTLVVSAIPEDMTLILTITLAIGARRLLAKGGVVRQLTAAETLGDTTVLCSDKTGTLTTGQISLVRVEGVADIWGTGTASLSSEQRAAGAEPHSPLLRHALTASLMGTDTVQVAQQNESSRGSAHERALARSAQTVGIAVETIRREYPLFDTLVFHPTNRYRASLHADPTRAEPLAVVVGAPDVLMPKCTAASDGGKSVRLSPSLRQRLTERHVTLAEEGRRVLTVATRHLSRETRAITSADVAGLTFLALLVFEDPLREDAKTAVASLQASGVNVMLLTGDHRGTAEAVARAVGILRSGKRVLDGVAIAEMSDEMLADVLPRVGVIARVDPLQKERVIQSLQSRQEIVTMVGDGVNDAVALRRADLGVAVGSATDIAKDASDLILLHKSITTLTSAVHEGRRVRETVRTVLAFLLSTNITEVLAVFGALLLGVPLPFLPAMLLWINIVTDGTADVALALEPSSTRPGDPAPGRRRGIFRSSDPLFFAWSSLAILVPVMLAYFVMLFSPGETLAAARTVAFVTLASAQLFAAFSFRSLDRPVITLNPLGNIWLVGAVASSFALLVVAVTLPSLRSVLGTVPLSSAQWTLAIGSGVLGALGVELRKFLFPSRWFPVGAGIRAVASGDRSV